MQLHVEVNPQQLQKFKATVKVLGYGTMSAYVRQKIREAIKEAEQISQEEPH